MKKRTLCPLLVLCFSALSLLSCASTGDGSSKPKAEEALGFDSFFEKLDRNFTLDVAYSASGQSGSYQFLFLDEKAGAVSSEGAYNAYVQNEEGIVILGREGEEEYAPYRLYSPNSTIDIYDVFFEGYDALKTLGKDVWEADGDAYAVKKESRKDVAYEAGVLLEAGIEKEELLSSCQATLSFEGARAHWDGTLLATIAEGGETYSISVVYNFTFSHVGTTEDAYLSRYLKNPTPLASPTNYHEEILSAFQGVGLSLPWNDSFSIGFAQSEGDYENSFEITDCLSSLDVAKSFASSLLSNGYSYSGTLEEGETFSSSDMESDKSYAFKCSSDGGTALVGVSFYTGASLTDVGKSLFPDGILSIDIWIVGALEAD